MGAIIRLDEWRQRHAAAEAGDDSVRLERAVGRLDRLLDGLAGDDAPSWLVTEILAIQGCLSMGLLEEAGRRAERVVGRCEHPSFRVG